MIHDHIKGTLVSFVYCLSMFYDFLHFSEIRHGNMSKVQGLLSRRWMARDCSDVATFPKKDDGAE